MIPLRLIPHIPMNELETLYRNEKTVKQARRYLAILEGYRTNLYPNTVKIGALLRVSRQTVGSWVRAWNRDGPSGLVIRKPTGRLSSLSDLELETFLTIIEQNPRDSGFNFSTWTLKAMRKLLQQKFDLGLSLSAISRLLKRNRIVRIVPRPMPAKGDEKKNKRSNKV